LPSDLVEARAMEPATFGRGGVGGAESGCSFGADVGAASLLCLVERASELDRAVEEWRD
jgi:hypothetical protein